MTYHDLLRKLSDVPFKPFRVRLTNGSAIDVMEPGAVIVGESSAVLPVEVAIDSEGYKVIRNWKTIAINHIVEFIDINAKDTGGSGRKRKGA